jgi:SAM-dependent methyltransferase
VAQAASVPLSAIVIPESVRSVAENSLGAFFAGVSKSSRKAIAEDHLDIGKSFKRAELLARYTPLNHKKLLEIGSGFGTNLAVWIKHHQIDGYGTEQDTTGFGASFSASRDILVANRIDAERIVPVGGDLLPFEDASFDIVYSANVLEHTENPNLVLQEAVRVLRPGGILHFELPNFLSYFEGHYMIFQPPMVWRWVLPQWVRLFGRDPAFARTMRTEINPAWCRRAVRNVNTIYPVKVLSFGDDIFLDRLAKPFRFEMGQTAGKLQTTIAVLQRLNVGNWIGRVIVALQGYYPIYLTLTREVAARPPA